MRRIDVNWTKVALHILLVSSILIAQSNLAYAQNNNPGTHNDGACIAGNLDINIYSDSNNTSSGDSINIKIEITNPINQVRNFNFTHKFNEIIVPPSKYLQIVKQGTPKKTDGHHCELSNDISDNRNYGSTLDRNGKITIDGYINGNTRTLTNYRTFIKNNTPPGSYPIFSRIDTTNFWYESRDDISSDRPKRIIQNISIIKDIDDPNENNESAIDEIILCVDIDPKYNRTDYSETNISIFEGTKLKISISGNKENLSNILFYDIYDGMKSTQSISTPNSYEVCRGDHSFSAEIYPKQLIYNNSTTFHAISLMQHHKSLVWDKGIYLSIIAMLALIIPYGLHRKFGKDNKYIISFVVLSLIIAYIWFIRDYLSNDMMYKDMIVFSYISLFAGLYLLMHVYHNGMDGLLVIFQAVCMVALVTYYNYYIDLVLSKTSILFIVSFIVLIISIVLNGDYKTSKGFQSMIAVILVVAGLFSAPFLSTINSGIPFSSRFELHHIIIIILVEFIPLMVIGITGRESVKVLQYIKDQLKLSSSSENSEGENKAK